MTAINYLILSTYPAAKSRNSGDDLLVKSLMKLLNDIKGVNVKTDVVPIGDTDISNKLKLDYHAVLAPALRLTPQGYSVVPKFRDNYLNMALKHNIPFYAIGSGWSQYPGTVSQSKILPLDATEINTFRTLFNQTNNMNGLSCRDIYTENVLKSNGIKCFGTTGDLGLFDTDYLGLPFKPPDHIETIAVSMPHNKHYFANACDIAVKLQKRYACKVQLVFHGYIDKPELPNSWLNSSIEIIDLAGGAEKLNYYHDIDLHVGFRLHAHIWFLRTRKPSLLIAEDGRGTGHLATVNGLGYSAAPEFVHDLADYLPEQTDEWRRDLETIPPSDHVFRLLDKEMRSDFKVTKHSLATIDRLWERNMKPFLTRIPERHV